MEEPAAVRTWREGGRFLATPAGRVFVVERGPREGPVLMVLHGFPGSSLDWHLVVSRLAEHVRVVAFDFLGYGLSDKPPDARYSLLEQADLAERVAAETGTERCVVVAHDMGDTVAAELLRRQAEGRPGLTVDRAVLTNGSIFIDLAQLSPGQVALLSLPDEPLPEPVPLEAFRPGLEATFSPDHPAPAEEVDAMIWLLRHGGGDRLLPRLIRYVEERRRMQDRWTEGLVGFPRPLSVLWGERDPIAVVAMVERLRELRPATEVLTWPDVGHWPQLEVPDRLAEAVLDRALAG